MLPLGSQALIYDVFFFENWIDIINYKQMTMVMKNYYNYKFTNKLADKRSCKNSSITVVIKNNYKQV